MPLTKCEEVSYPTHFLKSRGSVITNYFLEYRTKQATPVVRRIDVHALFFTNKTKQMLNRHFSCSCSDTIYSKSIKKNRKKLFLKVYHFNIDFYQSTFSKCSGVCRKSSDRIIHFNKNKNKLAPNC